MIGSRAANLVKEQVKMEALSVCENEQTPGKVDSAFLSVLLPFDTPSFQGDQRMKRSASTAWMTPQQQQSPSVVSTASAISTNGWEMPCSVSSTPLGNEIALLGPEVDNGEENVAACEQQYNPQLSIIAQNLESAFQVLVAMGEAYWKQQQMLRGRMRVCGAMIPQLLWSAHVRNTLCQIVKQDMCSTTVLVCALALIRRLCAVRCSLVCPMTARRVLIAAIVIAAKMHEDNYRSLTEFAYAASLSVETVKLSELQMLSRLGFSAFVYPDEYAICLSICVGDSPQSADEATKALE